MVLPSAPKRRVSLLVETSTAYGRGVLRGIAGWMREHDRRQASLGDYRGEKILLPALRLGECDGVIARIESPELALYLDTLKLAIVDVSQFRLLPRVPMVDTDNHAVARLAHAHFTERGFENFAFLGNDRIQWSRSRRLAFTACVELTGGTCEIFALPTSSGIHYTFPPHLLAKWVLKLPKPVAVFCAWDGFARQLLEVCRTAGIQVPEELAVLGVGNDDLETSFSQPQLSSIEPDAQGAGRAAAALLDARMNDPDGPVINVLLPPVRLIRRQSTDVLALDDSRLCAAIRMVREGACSGLRVEDVVKAVCLSRRQLEARFRRHLGRSPHQEILRTRLQRAKELLEETQLTLADVAERCGFEHVEYFHVVFKRHEKVTPGAWRLAHRSRKNR